MYAKALIPTDDGPDVPMVVVTSRPGPIIDQLHAQGWTPYGSGVGDVLGTLTITPTLLTLDTDNGRVLEDNDNPLSPAGWWEAVDVIGGCAVAVVVPSTDLKSPKFGEHLAELLDDPRTAHALVRVVT